MAIYDFRCEDCGEDIEISLSMNAPKPVECPSCGGHLIRIWNKPNIIYMDSGFTQYRGRNGAGEAITERIG